MADKIKNPQVAVIMGSDSDLPIMQEAVQMLQHFGIPHEVDIVSAHRTPEKLFAYAGSAEGRGIKVIIAGAGGAAHLPGMTASLTALPVIGVPIQTKALGGVDSLHSIVQMPAGVPVCTMAINGAKNAGIAAAQIIALSDSAVQKKLHAFKKEQTQAVEEKSCKLKQIGYSSYLNNK
ncbi:MAG: 5-(carboxyamino)imidazole ribonucleotide mutase [Firmicutes bacterium]|nr:5-(carboxyamino)imidazole ribonucleotide mutase [Bacillota bacterium]